MCSNLTNYGNAVGELVSRWKPEIIMLIGIAAAAYMYNKQSEFMAGTIEVQKETVKAIQEMNVRIQNLEHNSNNRK